jgi:hypothetical protein
MLAMSNYCVKKTVNCIQATALLTKTEFTEDLIPGDQNL